jgi:uncharacterized protein DUF6529
MGNTIQSDHPHAGARLRSAVWMSVPILVAAAVAAGLYVFGTRHVPDYSISLFGQTAADTLPLKSWLGTGLLALAGVQLGLALWIYGRLPGAGVAPLRVVTGHRLVGACALLLTLPIAYHCAFAYGVQTHVDARVAVHSIAGCLLYGAFAAKVTVVRSERFPGWTLPLVGGTLVALVAVLWYTSALWYFDGYRLPIL